MDSRTCITTLHAAFTIADFYDELAAVEDKQFGSLLIPLVEAECRIAWRGNLSAPAAAPSPILLASVMHGSSASHDEHSTQTISALK